MKQYVVLLLWLIAIVPSAYAQSCCATGAGSNWSILPNINKHTVGVRYTYRSSYSIYPSSLNPEMNGRRTDENMHTAEVFGRFKLHKRLQLSVYLPVNIIQQNEAGTFSKSAGLGDMMFLLQGMLLDPDKCYKGNSRHQLRVGAGLKLPSGQFKMDQNYMFTTNMQLGSGSLDVLFNAIYTYRYKQFGFNLLSSYKLNTYNPQQFKFGDKLQGGGNFFYVFKVKESGVQLMPTLGLYCDHNFSNRKNKDVLGYTGGTFVTTSAGLDLYYKRFALSASVIPTVLNKLNWSGEMKQRYAVEAGMYYNF